MALRESGARYRYGLSRLRIRAKNDDLTVPSKDNMIGGAGPFDFSSAADPAAVTGFLKRDNGAIEDFTIDLDDVGITISAVTVDQWVSAMIAGLAAASPAVTGYTPSKAATTGRAKLVSATGAYIQFWGEAAKLAKFGQGKGLKAIKSDTAQTFNESPTAKENTTQTITDANQKDTEVIIEGYKKGWTGSLVDTAEDYEMMEIVESGVLSADGLTYTDPASGTKKVEFEIETYNPIYGYGENSEDQILGWAHEHYKAVKGSVGERGKAAGFGIVNYALVGTNYKDVAGVESGAIVRERLAVTAWSPEAFDAI